MLDRFDVRILDTLQEQGDMGPVEMAQVVNLSPSQCSRRMQALKKDGYIRAVRAILDPHRLDVGVQAYVLVTMKSHSPEAAEAFRSRIMEADEVLECQKLAGAADMILKIATRDLQTFNRLLSYQLLRDPEVASAQSSIILEEVKSTTRLPIRMPG